MTPGVAVVLAGGGARGAYEAGVLSVLLPALEAHGMRPDLFMGTSAGAINAVGLASRAHLRATASSSAVLDLWREVHASSVFRGPLHGAFGKLFGRGHDSRRQGRCSTPRPWHERSNESSTGTACTPMSAKTVSPPSALWRRPLAPGTAPCS